MLRSLENLWVKCWDKASLRHLVVTTEADDPTNTKGKQIIQERPYYVNIANTARKIEVLIY